MHITFETGSEAPVPLLAWLVSVEAWLSSRGHEVSRRSGEARRDGPPGEVEGFASSLVVAVDGERRGRVALGWERGDVVATRNDGAEERWHYALAPAIPAPRRHRVPWRIVVGGLGDEGGRRSRMVRKVIEEIRRRRGRYLWLGCGLTADFQRTGPMFDEQFVDLTATEWCALLSSSSLVLEACDSSESASYEFRAAMSMGMPVVAHRSVVPADSARGVFTCDEWNADAFADTLTSLSPGNLFEPAVDHDELFSDAQRFFGIGN